MAYGDLRGTLSGFATSITGGQQQATGSVSVSVNDLILVSIGENGAQTATGVTDNLGNSYTAKDAGTLNGACGSRIFRSIATVAGTLTTITAALTNSADDIVVGAAVFGGPFSAVDTNPASVQDILSPFACPATGAMAEGDDLVIAVYTGTVYVSTVAATAPLLQAVNVASAANGAAGSVSTIIGYQKPLSSATIAPTYNGISAPTADVLSTITFKRVRAAGDLKGALTGGAVSAAGGGADNAVGSVPVSVGDLVVVFPTTAGGTAPSAVPTDDLGNTYSSLKTGLAAGTVLAARWDYTIVTVAGTLTTVHNTLPASANDWAAVVGVFAGPFASPSLDANPAAITNTTSVATPFDCPSSGTLAQASELVIGLFGTSRGQTNTLATAPDLLVANKPSAAANATSSVHAAMSARIVAATTAVAPQFTCASGTFTGEIEGTVSFKFSTGPTAWQGTAGLAGASALGAPARLTAQAKGTFSGASALVAPLRLRAGARATLAGASALGAAARLRARATSALAGASALGAAARLRARAVASFAGASALSLSAILRALAKSGFIGASALGASPVQIEVGRDSFAGASSLAGVAQLRLSTSAAFAGGSALSALPVARRPATAGLAVASQLGANAIKAIPASADFAGASSLGGSIGLRLAAVAGLAGASALAAALRQREIATAGLQGAGTFGAALRLRAIAIAGFSGASTLSGSLRGTAQARAGLSISSSAGGIASERIAAAAGLAVASQLGARLSARLTARASFNGVVIWYLDTKVPISLEAALVGASGFSANVSRKIAHVTVALHGSGNFGAVVQLRTPARAMLAVNSSAVAEPVALYRARAGIRADSQLSARLNEIGLVGAGLRPAGLVAARATLISHIAVAFDGTGQLVAALDYFRQHNIVAARLTGQSGGPTLFTGSGGGRVVTGRPNAQSRLTGSGGATKIQGGSSEPVIGKV